MYKMHERVRERGDHVNDAIIRSCGFAVLHSMAGSKVRLIKQAELEQ